MPKSALDRALEELVSQEVDEKDDFDSRVAALIIQEAREKNNNLSRSGSSSHPPEPRKYTNTRFLNNVIRGVQSHNRAVLHASTSAHRTEYGSRPDTSEQAENQLRQKSRSNGDSLHNSRGGRMRGWDDDDDESVKTKSDNVVDDRPSNRRRRRRNSTSSASEEREDDKRKRKHKERSHREKRKRRGHDDNHPYSSKHGRDTSERHQSGLADSSRRKNDHVLDELPGTSKMDRYFAKNYDPMMDVKAEVRQDSSGLIEDDGWDRMLKALKEKEERKRARKEGSRMESIDRSTRVGSNVLDTQYAGRGAQREWDKGKPDID